MEEGDFAMIDPCRCICGHAYRLKRGWSGDGRMPGHLGESPITVGGEWLGLTIAQIGILAYGQHNEVWDVVGGPKKWEWLTIEEAIQVLERALKLWGAEEAVTS
jgi:hypothetical protein